MMANSWQSPVAGEPSWGTLHRHREVLVSADPASTGSSIVTVTNVPSGAKGIDGYMSIGSGTAGRLLQVKDVAGNVWSAITNPTTAIRGFSSFRVPLDANKQFVWNVDNADVTSVLITMTTYFL
jgi:hypothetical protein